MAIFLKNATYIDPVSLQFLNTHIQVCEGKDKELVFFDSPGEQRMGAEDLEIDCTGKYVTRSFVVGHHHVYSALSRGMPAPSKSPKTFVERLEYIWWNIDKALDKDMIEACSLATAIACAKAGSTFVIDHHASPNFIKGSLQIIANAFEKVGVNHLLCYEITDRDGKGKAIEGLEESAEYLDKNQGLVGLHASFTVGDETLKSAVSLAEKTNSGIHIHVAEAESDQEHCIQNYGKRVVQRLHDAGAIESPKSILAHCLHLDEAERMLLKKAPVYIVQNMESNLNNGVGKFRSTGLNNNIMLGTDGMHSDMLRSTQAAYFAGQKIDEIDFMKANERLRKAHQYLGLNGFSGDGPNNLIIVDYQSPTDMNANNFLGHLIFGLTSNNIQHVIADGNLIVKDRIIQKVNEEEVLKFTREQSKRLWAKL